MPNHTASLSITLLGRHQNSHEHTNLSLCPSCGAVTFYGLQGRRGRGVGGPWFLYFVRNPRVFGNFNGSLENFCTSAVGEDEGFEFYWKIFEFGPLLYSTGAMMPLMDSGAVSKIQGWRQEFSDRGLTLTTRGLKYGFLGNYKCQKSPEKSHFTFLRGVACSDGGYSSLALPWRHPW